MVIVLVGVAGSGKTLLGRRLAQELAWTFIDADDFHSRANIDKMRAGKPLTDSDRADWLICVRAAIVRQVQAGTNVVVACSALKRRYRRFLAHGNADVKFVYLQGSYRLLALRLQRRRRHFMRVKLLRSQIQALEEPTPEEALLVRASEPLHRKVAAIRHAFGLQDTASASP